MPFCPNCGSSSEGRFCAKCGTPIPASAASAAAPPPPAPDPAAPGSPGYVPPPTSTYVPPPPGMAVAQAPGLQENLAGALCYLPFVGWIIGIVFLVIDPYKRNRNIKFHAFQSIFLFVALMIVWIVLRTISGILLASISFGLWTLFSMFVLIFDLAVLAVLLFLMFKAYNNQRFVLPIVGPLAEKQSLTV